MSRAELLDYLRVTYGADLVAVGLAATDTPETLFYILNDAMLHDGAVEVAERGTEQLLRDRRQQNAPAEGIDYVSNQ